MWQAIIWTNTDPIDWCISAALGGDELKYMNRNKPVGLVVRVYSKFSIHHKEKYTLQLES